MTYSPYRATKMEQTIVSYTTTPIKPLTDEEIIESAKKLGWSGDLRFLVTFARAIEAKVRGEG